ncbi:NUDT3 [Symbiodinium necroappetens]|uniref:NUDT3 protein n=1 Tax=Symbiodinium necroappetens TaxID=1628268 RepID=A0A812YXQ4_9DINO|nr:NUDT3 [Symbiodinium necroappetens]
MPSLEACKKHLDTESEMQFEDHMYEFVCSCKEISEYKGEALRQWIDVYVVSLKNPPELHKIFYDIKEATELKYVGVGELEQAYQSQDPSFVRVAAPDYARRLFHFLHKKIRVYLDMLPKVDSDEERHNKKGQQLLDRIGDVSMLSRAQDLNVIVDPCRRNEAYNESVWHRAVHVWVFDIEGGRFLIQQRSPKKRHFGGKWNCSTGHIKMGDPALPTAMKSVKDDVGIQDVEEADFEYLFQATAGAFGCSYRLCYSATARCFGLDEAHSKIAAAGGLAAKQV